MRRRLIVIAFCLFAVLPATAAVTGYVMSSEGQPIAGARIEIFALEHLDAARARLLSDASERKPITTAETDAKGKFTLESPRDPVVQLRVSAKGYAPEAYRIERDEEAGAVALTPADTKSGRITANGKPVAGARVIWSGAGEAIATTDSQGRYSVPDPAKWSGGVTVIHPDYAVLDDSVSRGFTPNTSPDRALLAGAPLSGTVVGEDGKTPVAGATVMIQGWPVATSAQDGTFTVAHSPAKWQIVVARSGALIGSRARAGNPTNVVVRLARAASLTGSIRDVRTQAPIAGADVRLRVPMRIDASDTWGTFTDAKGNFAINGIAPGSYQISVTRPGYTVAQVSLSLTANEKGNKSLLATQLARVTGMVVDEQKRPVAAARVSSQNVTRGDAMMMAMMMTGGRAPSGGVSAPDGTFIVRAEGDTDIHIAAVKKGYPPAKTATLRLAPGERKSGVVLTIPSGVAVSGRVVDKNAKPVSGVTVATTEATEFSGNMIRRMVALGAQRDRGDDLLKTANDGTFSLRVKEGSYDFAFKREGFATKTVRALQVNTATKPLEVTLEPGVEISGRVTRKGAGIEGVRIMAIAEGAQASAETAPDGSFRIADLTPGQMMLNATKEEEFIQQIRPVTAPASDVNIEIPPGGRISGRVVDKTTKQPVTSFQAGVSTPRGGGGMVIMMPPALRTFTTDDGTFVLENVPAGQTQIVVNAPGYTTARVANISVEEGKNLSDIEVEMDRGVRVVGHVTGPDGATLAGVAVRLDMMGGRVMRPPMQNQSAITDANGDYSIEALESGDKTFIFTRSGYLTTQKSATLSGNETRVDAQLGNGMRISGVVVTESGVPVSDAGVNAMTAGYSGPTPNTMTDTNGAFSFEGLAPGHYNFIASKRGLMQGDVRDVDITSGAPVRIILKSGGVIYGHVSGLTADEMQQATVITSGPSGGSSGPVDGNGNFRIEGAPTGTVRVSARLQGGIAGGKTSPVQSVQLEPGNQVEVNIAFNADTVIHGRVTRNGTALGGAMVAFMPKDAQAQTSARTTTNSSGEYTVNGLDDATYNVSVVDLQRSAPFSTTYQVRGSGSFDVDMKSASLRGRVNDSEGNAVADAMIELREKTAGGSRFAMRGVQTDASGMFILDNVAAGSYSVTAEKDGYGTKAVDTTVGDSGAEVQITLTKNAGVTLHVVDARDGRVLGARVHVTDARDATVYDSPFMGASTDAIKLPLEPGMYRALITAPGYAAQNATITSPSNPTIGMTPGGSIIVQSKGSGLRRARLLGPDGKEYIRGFGPAIFTVDPSPGVTVLNNIAPGMYTLQILGDGNQVTASAPVSVADGQQANVSI